MTTTADDRPKSCACSGGPCALAPGREPDAGEVSGTRMVWTSALVFLFPLLAAAVGAIWGRGSPLRQLLAAMAGFGLGAGLAAGWLRWVRPASRRNP